MNRALVILLGVGVSLDAASAEQVVGDRGTVHGDQSPVALEDVVRPLDDSDEEMRSYLQSIHTGQGCPKMPYEECPEAVQPYADGGDRLARYLISQVEASDSEGHPKRSLPLVLIAYTRSDTGFEYLTSLVENRDELGAFGSEAIRALGKSGDERALDQILEIIDEEKPETPHNRAAAVRGLFRIMEATGSRREDAVAAARRLKSDPRTARYATRKMDALGIE